MISEAVFSRYQRRGEWIRQCLVNDTLYAIRFFDSHSAMNEARSYYNSAVILTEPFPTPEAAAQAAVTQVEEWTSANPYSNLGTFAGVLITPEGLYRGGYQKMWSST